jgi:hypothetical protein
VIQSPDDIPATLAELLDLIRRHAEWVGNLLNAGRLTEWTPTLCVLTRAGPAGPAQVLLHTLDVPFERDREKRETLRRVGRSLFDKLLVPAAAVLSGRGWLAPAGGPPPSQHPERVEAVVLCASAVGGRPAACQEMPIGRDPDGVILPGPWSPPATDEVTTPLLNEVWEGYLDGVAPSYGGRRRF